MNETSLKPCPLCDGPAYIERYGNDHTKIKGVNFGCRPCGIKIEHRGIRSTFEQLFERAIAHWNRRSSPQKGGEAVAWMHTLTYETGQKSPPQFTTSAENPFGVPGKDYSETFPLTSAPLYTHPSHAPVAWTRETINDAPNNLLYILKPKWHDEYEQAVYEEGRRDFREVHMSAKLYTKHEAVKAFERTGGEEIEFAVPLPPIEDLGKISTPSPVSREVVEALERARDMAISEFDVLLFNEAIAKLTKGE